MVACWKDTMRNTRKIMSEPLPTPNKQRNKQKLLVTTTPVFVIFPPKVIKREDPQKLNKKNYVETLKPLPDDLVHYLKEESIQQESIKKLPKTKTKKYLDIGCLFIVIVICLFSFCLGPGRNFWILSQTRINRHSLT